MGLAKILSCTNSLLYSIPIRSLLPKLEELQVLVSVHKPLNIICITESWTSHDITDQGLSIPGFHLFRRDRNRHGGGVSMYVSDTIQCKRLNIICAGEDLEILSIAVHNECSKMAISLFYRPPNSTSELFTSLANYLEKVDMSQFSSFMLLGDFNVDYSNPSHPLFDKLDHIACGANSEGANPCSSQPFTFYYRFNIFDKLTVGQSMFHCSSFV